MCSSDLGRDERRLVAHPLRDLEAEDVAVERQRAVDVGDLEVHVADVDSRVNAHEPTLALPERCQEALDGRGTAVVPRPLPEELRAPGRCAVQSRDDDRAEDQKQSLNPGCHRDHLLPDRSQGQKVAVPNRGSHLLSRLDRKSVV